MSLLDKCKAILIDPHPERDETHSATREKMNPLHCPPWPCPGANPALCATCEDTRKPLSVAKPLYERELPLVDTPAQDTLDQRFAAFHKAHPEVLKAIWGQAVSLSPFQPIMSMDEIVIVVRRLLKMPINNDFTSRYTDLLIETFPEFEGRFHRRARAKGKTARHYVRAH